MTPPASGPSPSLEDLRALFAPRSIALVGASDDSGWAANVVDGLRLSGFPGPIEMVHPTRSSAFGQPTKRGLRDLDRPVDMAFSLAPTHAVGEVLDDAAAAGIRNLVVLASGFGEAGDEGRDRQGHLVARAEAHGVTLLGPNGLGFINTHAQAAPFGLRITPPLFRGPVGVVLQSGALAGPVLTFAKAHGIGTSLLVSMGNEAMVTTADVLEYLIHDENTRVIALFLEGIRQPERFRRLAREATAAGKPIVAVKVGRSVAAQQTALAHTGAIAGDEAVADAALRQLGVIRVNSMEELLITAGVLGYCPLPSGRRMGVVTGSGGACDLIADLAEEQGIEMPSFTPDTVARLGESLPPGVVARNPLDVTGFGLARSKEGTMTTIDDAVRVVTADEAVDFVLYLGLTLPESPSADTAELIDRRVRAVSEVMHGSPIPVLTFANMCVDLSPFARETFQRHGVHQIGGIDLGMKALGHALRWDEWRRARRRPPALTTTPSLAATPKREGSWSEVQARDLLVQAGVPVVPAELTDSAEAAVQAAERMGLPVAMKVCSAEIPHKSDIGGVALGLSSPEEIRAAYHRLIRAVTTSRPGAGIDGVLVSPMRDGGVELLVGVTVDPTFGPVLALGLGGIWVETLRDTSLRLLPVDATEIRQMLTELRGAAMLSGARGSEAADLDRIAEVVHRIGSAASALGPSLQALEVNPLWVRGGDVQALDALVVTQG